jgi:hypothetical protein
MVMQTHELGTLACSTGVVNRGIWWFVSRRYLSCALLGVCSIVYSFDYLSVANTVEGTFVMVLPCH